MVDPKKLETALRFPIHYSSGLRLLGFQLLGVYYRVIVIEL